MWFMFVKTTSNGNSNVVIFKKGVKACEFETKSEKK